MFFGRLRLGCIKYSNIPSTLPSALLIFFDDQVWSFSMATRGIVAKIRLLNSQRWRIVWFLACSIWEEKNQVHLLYFGTVSLNLVPGLLFNNFNGCTGIGDLITFNHWCRGTFLVCLRFLCLVNFLKLCAVESSAKSNSCLLWFFWSRCVR